MEVREVNPAQAWIEQWAKLGAVRYQAMLERGKCGVIAEFNEEETKLIRQIKRVVRPEAQQCFANAQRAVTRVGEPFIYTEGYVELELGISIEHAWLTLNGKVVEITPLRRGASKLLSYFGVEIDINVVRNYMLETRLHGPILGDWEAGLQVHKACAGVVGRV